MIDLLLVLFASTVSWTRIAVFNLGMGFSAPYVFVGLLLFLLAPRMQSDVRRYVAVQETNPHIVALIVLGFMGVLFSVGSGEQAVAKAGSQFLLLIFNVAGYFAVARLVSTSTRLYRTADAWVVGALAVGVYSIYQVFAYAFGLPGAIFESTNISIQNGLSQEYRDPGTGLLRAYGLAFEAVWYANFLLPSLFLSFGLFLSGRKPPFPGAYLVSVVTLFVALALTFSRTAWLSWFVGACYFLLRMGAIRSGRTFTRLAWLSLVAAAFGVAFVAVAPHSPSAGFSSRLKSLSLDQGALAEENTSRYTSLMTSLAMFSNNPVLGVGYANFGARYYEYKTPVDGFMEGEREGREPVPVSGMYARMLAEGGLAGLAVFGAILGAFLRRLRVVTRRTRDQSTKVLSITFESAVIAVATNFLTISSVNFFHQWFFFSIIAGFVLVERNTRYAASN